MSRIALTPRQSEIFEWIKEYLRENQIPPSIREIAEEFQISSPNGVLCHLRSLEEKGWIERSEGARKIRILGCVCPYCGK